MTHRKVVKLAVKYFSGVNMRPSSYPHMHTEVKI